MLRPPRSKYSGENWSEVGGRVSLVLLTKGSISVLHINVKPEINIFRQFGTRYRVVELDVTGHYSSEDQP